MQSENLNIAEITEARRKAIRKTIRPIGIEELKALEGEIFRYHDDPWRERFTEFVKENAGSTFYHATTDDPIQIIYCHAKDKGIWFLSGTGVGPLQEKGLKIMKQIVERS